MAARDVGAIVSHHGSLAFRNVSDAVDVYDVRVSTASESAALDLVCQMRVPTMGESALALEWSGRRYYFCGLPCVARFAAAPETYLGRQHQV